MKIENLKIFLETAQSGSMHEASRKLYMSHQNLNKIIKNMEAELNTQLFVRSPKGIQLNNNGKEVFVAATQIVTNYESMLEKLHTDSDIIKFYTVPSFSSLATILQGRCFNGKYLSVYKRDANEIIKMIERGKPGIYFMSVMDDNIDISDNTETHVIPSSNLSVLACHKQFHDLYAGKTAAEINANKFITNTSYDHLKLNTINIDDIHVCKRLMRDDSFIFSTEMKLFTAEFPEDEWDIISKDMLAFHIQYTIYFNLPDTPSYQAIKEQVIERIETYFGS